MAIVFRSGDIISADLLMKKFDEFIKVDLSNLPKLPDTGVLPGTLLYTAFQYVPENYLVCNGASLSKSLYSKLFDVIGYSHGGSGNNFNIPDLRGYFIRTYGGRSESIGVAQSDAIRNITGSTYPIQYSSNWGTASGVFYLSGNEGNSRINGAEYAPQLNFDASRVVPTAAENRPINKSFHCFIKY